MASNAVRRKRKRRRVEEIRRCFRETWPFLRHVEVYTSTLHGDIRRLFKLDQVRDVWLARSYAGMKIHPPRKFTMAEQMAAERDLLLPGLASVRSAYRKLKPNWEITPVKHYTNIGD
jgi:hypothetical protein